MMQVSFLFVFLVIHITCMHNTVSSGDAVISNAVGGRFLHLEGKHFEYAIRYADTGASLVLFKSDNCVECELWERKVIGEGLCKQDNCFIVSIDSFPQLAVKYAHGLPRALLIFGKAYSPNFIQGYSTQQLNNALLNNFQDFSYSQRLFLKEQLQFPNLKDLKNAIKGALLLNLRIPSIESLGVLVINEVQLQSRNTPKMDSRDSHETTSLLSEIQTELSSKTAQLCEGNGHKVPKICDFYSHLLNRILKEYKYIPSASSSLLLSVFRLLSPLLSHLPPPVLTGLAAPKGFTFTRSRSRLRS